MAIEEEKGCHQLFTHISKRGIGVDSGFSHWDEDEGGGFHGVLLEIPRGLG